MSLSKPYKLIFSLLGDYYGALYNNPIKTKSLTSCTISMMANLTSQYMSGMRIDHDSLVAFGLFGFLFGGSVPHFFYQWLERVAPDSSPRNVIKQLVLERLIFTPLYQFFVLYTLARLEAKSHQQAMRQIVQIYWPLLSANWTWITIPQVLNFTYVPPILRVLVTNLIGYVWTVFLSHKKRKADSLRSRLE